MRSRGIPSLVVVALAALAWWAPAFASPPLPPTYNPAGKDAWDYWFARIDGVYHAFYMQSPVDAPTIGMARSPDLLHWTEYGEVIAANPPSNPWCDGWVATGATWLGPTDWMTAFTGVSTNGIRGMGMAMSHDHEVWTKLANTGPIPITHQPFVVPQSDYWQSRGFAEGLELNWFFISDPYVLPEPIDGWYYLVYSALLADETITNRGCNVLARSLDGLSWDDVAIISAPHLYDQCEAPQLWKHGHRWYLLFGAARDNPLYRATMVYTAPTMEGPFEPPPSPEITVPDPGWFYGGRVFQDPKGDDVLMGFQGNALSRPYPVNYDGDGSVWLGPYDDAFTQWTPNGLTAYAGPLVSDMGGGVIARGTYRVNGNGADIWGPGSSTTATAWASDSMGGVIGTGIASNNIFALRTTRTGTRPWGSSANVCSAAQAQITPVVVPDGNGGAFFAWADFRSGTSNDIYAQHLNASGTAVWTANGVAVCTAAGAQTNPAITPDGLGGLIVTWQDDRPGAVGGTDLYAQRLIPSGAAVWGPNGVPVVAATGSQQAPVIRSDGVNGAIIAWADPRNGALDIYAQRMNSDGSYRWGVNGTAVSGEANDQLNPAIEPDGAEGVFVTWEDHRAGADIYAQHLTGNAAALWNSTGVPVCGNGLEQNRPSIAPDGSGGVVIAWMDARDDAPAAPTYYTPYAQRVTRDGVPLWPSDGVRVEVTQGTSSPTAPSIASDLEGGAFVSGTNGLQRVRPDGRIGWSNRFAGLIADVADVPGDQGGHVNLTFLQPASEAEQLSPAVTRYDVWRKIGPSSAPLPPSGWEIVATVNPSAAMTHAVVVPTHTDSTSLGDAPDAFCVVSTTTSATVLAPSAVVSGHSVDDLAPQAPSALTATRTDTLIHLTWSAPSDPDIAHYEVHRGTTASFVPSAATLAGQPTSPQFDVPFVIPDSLEYFKVRTVDLHGNVSPLVPITLHEVADAPRGASPAATSLRRIAPNPMIDRLNIEYGVAVRGPASIVVYDLSGRRVRSLAGSFSEAGVGHVVWDGRDEAQRRVAPGVYLVRLAAGGIRRSAKVVIAN